MHTNVFYLFIFIDTSRFIYKQIKIKKAEINTTSIPEFKFCPIRQIEIKSFAVSSFILCNILRDSRYISLRFLYCNFTSAGGI